MQNNYIPLVGTGAGHCTHTMQKRMPKYVSRGGRETWPSQEGRDFPDRTPGYGVRASFSIINVGQIPLPDLHQRCIILHLNKCKAVPQGIGYFCKGTGPGIGFA